MQAIAEKLAPPDGVPLVGSAGPPSRHYPVSAVAAGILHLTSGRAFIAFHLVLACVAIAVPFALSAVRRSPELRVGVSLLIVGGAVPAALLSWVGSYDPVSIGGAAVGALASNPVVRAFGWMLFAFNNAGEAAIALAIYVVILWVARGRPAFPTIVVSALAVVAGYVGIRILTAAWGGGESEFTMMKYLWIFAVLTGLWLLAARGTFGSWSGVAAPGRSEVRHLRAGGAGVLRALFACGNVYAADCPGHVAGRCRCPMARNAGKRANYLWDVGQCADPPCPGTPGFQSPSYWSSS